MSFSSTTPTTFPSSNTGSWEILEFLILLYAIKTVSSSFTLITCPWSARITTRSLKSFFKLRLLKPLLLNQASSKTFDKYLFPVSHIKVTTLFGSVCDLHHSIAPATRVPADDPARIPSFFNKISKVSNALPSCIVTASSI